MLSASERVTVPARPGQLKSLARWWAVGIVFMGWTMGALYLLSGIWRWSVPVASLVIAELGTILRFFVNDRWVFEHRRPTLRRFWQYHVANAGGFVIWWSVCNVLPVLGVHYLIASVAATCCSVGFSMATNFLWIWRRKQDNRTAQ